METPRAPETSLRSSLLLLSCIAAVVFLVYLYTGNGYGFHRDELQFLDDARHLHWGFVAYPPMTSFMGRIAIALFGISPMAFRLPTVLTNMVCLVLLGLITRELGGRLAAQALAAIGGLTIAIVFSTLMQYNTFDYLAWSLATFFTARMLRTENPRWWIGIGAAIGFGVLSKYSIAMLAISILAGIAILPSQRKHLRSRYFYLGILALFVVAAPNLIWLATHHFLTLQMESHIHARDIELGRTKGYYADQLHFIMFGMLLAIPGMVRLLRSERFRLLAFFWIGPFLLFALAQGRGYYLMPAYIPLYAAGAVAIESFLSAKTAFVRIAIRTAVVAGLLADTVLLGMMFLPIAKPLSPLWNFQMKNNGDMRDEIGWPELVAQVAAVRDSLPPQDRERLGILTGNYGEAGALALYGPDHGLPAPISHINSWQLRGLGPYVPDTVIAVGVKYEWIADSFESCKLVAPIHIPYNVRNEEATEYPGIYVCRHHLGDWRKDWPNHQAFG